MGEGPGQRIIGRARQGDSTAYRRALELQPSNAQAYFSYSRFLASRGRLDQAIGQIRKAVEFDPLSLELKANVALLHYFAGHYDSAAASLEDFRRGLAGRRGDARAILDTLQVRSRSTYVPAYWFALVHAGLGDTAATLGWLERAYQERSTVLAYLRIDPRLDLVRDQPRFAGLVRQMAGDSTP